VERVSVNKDVRRTRQIIPPPPMEIAHVLEVKTTDLGVEWVVRLPVFSQSGILSYFPYEFDHPRPIDRPNRIVPVLYV